ncbi:MAG: glutamine synthetase beta-grasp domain-containing protein, partial [bacterium]
MTRKIKEVLKYAEQNKIEMVDLKFCDLFGRWHHLTIPISQFDESVFMQGVTFDGSSVPGFKKLESGDMVLIPDIDTMLVDKFWHQNTLSFICSAYEADTLELFKNDPRNVAYRAEQFLKANGIADESLWSPEFEFYIFDSITYINDINLACYRIDSEEAEWNSGVEDEQNLG